MNVMHKTAPSGIVMDEMDAAAEAGEQPDLPPPDTTRWVSSRKAQVVHAIRAGQLTEKDACARYGLTVEELESWQRLVERHGTHALRATRVQDYRNSTKRKRYR